MSDPSTTKFRFRFTLRSLMILVLGSALDFSLIDVLRKKSKADLPSITLLVIAYDFLVYFSLLALRLLLSPKPRKPVSWVFKSFAFLHIGLFAGVPIVVAASAMLGLW